MNSKKSTSLFVVEIKNWENMDTYQLLLLFPEEIWKVILENARDLKSLDNLSNASLFFRERLRSKRSIFLFPKVFECLMKFHEKNDEAFSSQITNLGGYTVGKVCKFPWGLRLICLDWNKSFEDYVRKPKINPFVKETRYVSYSLRISDYTQFLLQMMAKFGRTLRSVRLRLGGDETQNLSQSYLLLIKTLICLPRLKDLEIISSTTNDEITNNNQLAQTIETNPCPQLNKLESLNIIERFPSQIIKELVRQNNGFKRLILFLNYVQSLTFDLSTPLPNLEHLRVSIRVDQDFQKLKHCAKNWKLVSFECQLWQLDDKNSWLEIFEMIEDNWGNTLEKLSLYLARYKLNPGVREMILSITKDERLSKLSALKSVEIFSDCAISLDFLLPCQDTLEEMLIFQYGDAEITNRENAYYNNAKDGQIVEYLGKENRMENSNLWNLFPKLQLYHSRVIRLKRPAKYC